ncbi:hypothetical protein, partial [Streptomyces halstedii]|uniref:hypothetical protein n=1 Tax=Streptomyces halstedii TaxID=1944 RepID=UPI0033B8DADF
MSGKRTTAATETDGRQEDDLRGRVVLGLTLEIGEHGGQPRLPGRGEGDQTVPVQPAGGRQRGQRRRCAFRRRGRG